MSGIYHEIRVSVLAAVPTLTRTEAELWRVVLAWEHLDLDYSSMVDSSSLPFILTLAPQVTFLEFYQYFECKETFCSENVFFQVMKMPCFEGKISLWIHKMYIFWKLQLINTPGWVKFASCRQLEFLSENAKFCSSTYLINKSNPSSDFWWIQLLVGGITILHNIVPWFSWKCLASKFASLQGISNYLNL